MDMDYGVMIGLIGAVCMAGMLGLSYVGAFLLGQTRGRREAERELAAQRAALEAIGDGQADRLRATEDAVHRVARAVERLTEAQRILLLEQSRQASPPSDPRAGSPRLLGRNTPA